MHATPPKLDQGTVDYSFPPDEPVADSRPVNSTLGFLAPPLRPDELGRLGHYRILKVLGQGGMGMVFLAEDTKLDRHVALKVMLPKFAADPMGRQRFLREAKTAAQIEHDYIVPIFEVGEDRGVPYLAMQLLSGASLEDVLRRAGRLTVPQVLRLGAQIAEGLAVAHAKGLIHRDIKPANIWVEANCGGRVKLLDFGLARTVQSDVNLTHSGAILGTPAYMAPEQARGDTVDPRCDLYALGSALYRMSTGELPIKGKDTMALLMALALNEPLPPRHLNADIPEALDSLIMMLLAKDATQRPESAKAVASALRKLEGEFAATGQEADVTGELIALAKLSPGDSPVHAPADPLANQGGNAAATLAADLAATQLHLRRPTQLAPTTPRRKLALAGAIVLVLVLIAAVIIMLQMPYGSARTGDGAKVGDTSPVPSPPVPSNKPRYGLLFDTTRSHVVADFPFAAEPTLTIEARLKILDNDTPCAFVDLCGGGDDHRISVSGPKFLAWTIRAPWRTAGAYHNRSKHWMHLACVTVSPNPAIYLDGVVGTEFGTGKPAESGKLATPRLAIGSFMRGAGALNGVISEFRITLGVRYRANFTPPARFERDKDTLVLYHFDDGQGSKLTDHSGHGHHGRIIGAKWVTIDEANPAP